MNEKDKTILLVEDEPVISLIETSILKKGGYSVKSVQSGEKAIELISSGEKFDLILMDIDLGKNMDGTEAAERILEICEIPILFLSSHTEPEVVDKTEGITSYGYVVKNCGDTVLLASIRMAFRLFQERRQVQQHKEKLQSLNEELEAANEELNAAFEELEATNEELVESQRDIQSSEERFRRLFTSSNDGICLHEIIFTDGIASDYRILDVNPVFESVTGLKKNDVAGKTASEVYKTGTPPYLDIYSQVADTEIPATFEAYFEPMDRHFHISVFSPGKGMFVTVFQDISDRIWAENVLHERERELNLIIKSMMNAFVLFESVFDDEGNFVSYRFVFINDAYERITGVRNDEVKGRTVHEVWPGTEQGWVDAYGSVAVTGVSRSFEMYHEPTGKLYYCSVYRPGETSDRFCVIFEDITQRRNSENSIRESEEKFRNIFRHSPLGLLHYDNRGVITECNEIFIGIIGSSSEQLTGLDMRTLKDEKLVEALNRALSGDTGYYEGDYKSVTGSKTTAVRVWFTPIFTADKTVNGGICITEDISVQKRALAEIEERERRFRNLFETLTQGIVYHDADGKITAANPAAERILGITVEQMTGVSSMNERWRTVREDYSDFPGEEHPAMTALRTGEPVRDIIMGVYNPADEAYRWIRIDAMPEFRENEKKPFRVYASFTDITEMRQAERILRDSEERYRSLAEVSPNAILIHQNGKIVYANDTAAKLFGAESQLELVGMDFIGRVHPDSINMVEERIRFVTARGERVPAIELVMRKTDGSGFFAESMAGPIMHNGLPAVQVVLRDITDRKRYEIAADEQKQFLDILLNAIPAPVFYKDAGGRYLGCNDAFADFTGYEKEKIIGKTVFDISPLEFAEVYHTADIKIMESGEGKVYETDVKHADGSIRHVLFHKAVFYNRDGMVKGLVGVMLDISERKRYEDNLRRMKEDLEKAQGTAHMGSWKWFIKEDRLEWSDEMYHIFDIDKSTFSGKLSDILMSSIHPDDREKVESANRMVSEEGKPNAAEFRIVRKDGAERIVWSEAGDLESDEQGEPLILSGYLQDITERKKTEEKLEKAVNEKEALLREVQHRIKNNLAMIVGLIGIESTRTHGDEAVKMLSSLRNRIGALEKLYSSLYQSGGMGDIKLDSYIIEVAKSIMNTYVSGIKNIRLETDLDPVVLPIREAGSIGLIVNELMINSLKYAFPDGRDGEIRIGLKAHETGFDLYTADNGIGPPEGFSIENSTGSGIMIIKMMAEHMGGSFSFSRSASTEFRVSIPYGE